MNVLTPFIRHSWQRGANRLTLIYYQSLKSKIYDTLVEQSDNWICRRDLKKNVFVRKSVQKEDIRTMWFTLILKRQSQNWTNNVERLGIHCRVFCQVKTYFHRFLFWLSGETSSSIQRSDVTGQRKTTLIKIATKQLKTLSIDREEKRLFWVQFGPQGESAVSSCDYNGNNLHIIDHPLQWACSLLIFYLFLPGIFQYSDQDKSLFTGLSHWGYQFFCIIYTTLMLHLGL